MKRGDLLSYARAKYGIQAKYKWLPQKDNCVLISPATGHAFAMFTQVEQQSVVDIKCGSLTASQLGIKPPFMMKDNHWVGVVLDDDTPEKIITHLLDLAFHRSMKTTARPAPKEHLIVVPPLSQQSDYQDRTLPTPPQRFYRSHTPQVPAAIRKMKSLYDYTLPSIAGRAKNFYVQAKAMADYQDDYAYTGRVTRYFPTYHDFDNDQLRGYFAWRTKVRKGNVEQTSLSFAYLYVYELINQIGVANPKEGYDQLLAFIDAYRAYADKRFLKYLDQWLKDYVIYYNLGDKLIAQHFANEITEDQAFDVLVNEAQHSSAEVRAALEEFSAYQLGHCPLQKKDSAMLDQVVKASWHQLVTLSGKNPVANMLGWQATTPYYPFSSAVFYDRQPGRNGEYQVDSQLIFHCQNGRWQRTYYLPTKNRRQVVGNFLHEIDRLVRQVFHLGRQLKRRAVDDETVQAIEEAIKIAQHQLAVAQRPKVKIDFGRLDKIRADASVTRESLLTDEERAMEQAGAESVPVASSTEDPATSAKNEVADNEFDLTADEYYLLLQLLHQEPWQKYVKEHHLMVNMLVDSINEKLFDEIGDTVIEFNDANVPQIIEDYQPDLEELFQ